MITVIGTGTGLTAPVVPADATLVVGARRHVDAAAVAPGVRRVILGPLAPALDAVAEHVAAAAAAKVVVLASGDPGFFGIVRALAERFGSASLDVRPSSPSVAVAFARLGLTWDDAAVVSAHGRDPRAAVNVCRAHPKTAVLTGPGAGPAELGAALADTGIARTLVVAAALGTAQESVERLSPGDAAARDWSGTGVSVVLCLDESRLLSPTARTVAGPPSAPAGWALPEEAFAHRDSMVTKYEVRALALARLGPRTGDLVWDIGAGSGSVAVECARFGAAAVAVERSADGIDRIRANAAAHGVDVQAVHGSAPAVLDRLPDPDAVFIGGGGRDLPAIVTACGRRARRVVVVTLAALDRVAEVRAALTGAGLDVEGVLLQSSRLAPLPGDVSRLAATNPVFVLWATRDDGRRGGRGTPPAPGTHGLPSVSVPPPGYDTRDAARTGLPHAATTPAPGAHGPPGGRCRRRGAPPDLVRRCPQLGARGSAPRLSVPGIPARRLRGQPDTVPSVRLAGATRSPLLSQRRPPAVRRHSAGGDGGGLPPEAPRTGARHQHGRPGVRGLRRLPGGGTDPIGNRTRTPVRAAPPRGTSEGATQ